MFLLETQSPESATGTVAQSYAAFPKGMGVPVPLQLLSASPKLLERQMELIRLYMTHPRLTPGLLAAIRYAAAVRSGHVACQTLNQGMLERMGMGDQEICSLPDPNKEIPLEESEALMFRFVMRCLDDPASITAADVEALHEEGYADSDILDAVFHGAGMLAGAVLYKAFVRP